VCQPHLGCKAKTFMDRGGGARGRRITTGGLPVDDGDDESHAGDSGSNPDLEIDRQLLQQYSNAAVKRPLSGVCQPCRKAKVRCDRHLPCSRCVRLDLPCRPQCRGKNRLLDGNKGESASKTAFY